MSPKQKLLKKEPLKSPLTYPAKAVQAIQKYNEYLMNGYSPQQARIKTAVEMILTMDELNELLVNLAYFNDTTLQFLAKSGIAYEQYQKMQRVVQKAVEELRQDGLPDEKIKSRVNKLIQRITQEFDSHKKITFKHWNLQWASHIGYKINAPQESRKQRKPIKKQSFSYPSMPSNSDIKLPDNITDLQIQFDQVASTLANLPRLNSDSMELIKKEIQKGVVELAKTVLGIGELTNNDNQQAANGVLMNCYAKANERDFPGIGIGGCLINIVDYYATEAQTKNTQQLLEKVQPRLVIQDNGAFHNLSVELAEGRND